MSQERGGEISDGVLLELRGQLPEMDFYVFQEWELEQVLPWSHLKGPLPEATLKKHLAEAMTHFKTEDLQLMSQERGGEISDGVLLELAECFGIEINCCCLQGQEG